MCSKRLPNRLIKKSFRAYNTGNWREFTLTAIYQDSDGYTRIDRYKQNDIPSGQAPALSAAVAVIADMEEDWQAVQVWARLGNTSVLNNSAGDDEAVEFREAVLLTIEAVNSLGGRRIFTPGNYAQFILMDFASISFFKYFTIRK